MFRSIQDCWIWNDEKYDKAHAWIDLLLDANHTNVKISIDGKPTVVKRGSFYTSKLNLASKWRWDRKTVINFLSTLESDGMITQEVSRHGTTITIVNYRQYQQSADTTTDTITDTTTDTSTDTKTDINKNDKNDKKYIEKENIKEKDIFSPPSVSDVAAYYQERNNGVDPQRFCDFYQTKGWMVGKNRMKDWKAAVRTWERRDGVKPAEQDKQKEKWQTVRIEPKQPRKEVVWQ